MLLAVIIIAATACGPKAKFDPTPEGEFENAMKFYTEGSYRKSIDRFRDIIYKYPGSDLVEQARFFLADSYLKNEDYQLAADEFERLNREFPQGQFADESLFKAGISYGSMMRRPERDQAETMKSLETLELLLAKYPGTNYADTARAYIGYLKNNLAVKELQNAMFYYQRNAFDASIIYLKGLISDYPDTPQTPEALYYLFKASRQMGYPDDADDAKNWLCRDFPESHYADEICTAEVTDSTATGNKTPEPAETGEEK